MGEQENGVSATATPSPASEIVKQVEYYFGDLNLSRDKFLLAEIAKNDGCWVDMAIMMKFNRLAKLAANKEDVVLDALSAVEETGLMEVDHEAKRIRRKPSRPLPADREQYMSDLASRTVYVKGFGKEMQLDEITKILEPHGPLESVFMRRFKADPGVNNFKGSTLVTFRDVATAEKFLAAPAIKCGENELIRKWKNDWSLEKEEEVRLRKEKYKKMRKGGAKQEVKTEGIAGAVSTEGQSLPKKRKFEEGEGEETEGAAGKKTKTEGDEEAKTEGDGEAKAGGDGEAKAGGDGEVKAEGETKSEAMDEEGGDEGGDEEEEDDLGLFPGTFFRLRGIPKEDVHVRDIRNALKKYEVSGVEVAFVTWELGDEEAIVRLKERDTAEKALEYIHQDKETLKLKDVTLTAVAIVGEEEVQILKEERARKKTAMAAKRERGDKQRRGGGRGGGRGRGFGRGRGWGGGRRGRGRGRRS